MKGNRLPFVCSDPDSYVCKVHVSQRSSIVSAGARCIPKEDCFGCSRQPGWEYRVGMFVSGEGTVLLADVILARGWPG
jgi:hypothetical protein